MTLDQVRADIKSGKCKAIYICSKSLCWTHLESDLEEMRTLGLRFNKNAIGLISPVGAPLIVNNHPAKWIHQSTNIPKHMKRDFQKYGNATLMKAHHRNNKTHYYNKWSRYDALVEKDRKAK